MVEVKNGIAPFSTLVLEAVVKIQEEGGYIPLYGENSLQPALFQFLNDKGYVEVSRGDKVSHIRLSKKGFDIYNRLVEYVTDEINL